MVTLNEAMRERLARALHDESISMLESAEELHIFAVNWNWDWGIRPLIEIIQSPLCDKGTALLIYWYCSPVAFYKRHRSEETVIDGYEQTIYRLMKEAEQKYQQGFYTHQAIQFDPAKDWQEPYQGEELMQPIPAIMLQPSPGQSVNKSDLWLDAD